MNLEDLSTEDIVKLRAEQSEKIQRLGILLTADNFVGPINASWTVITYNNNMGWGFSDLVGNVIFIDKSFYVVGKCKSQARGRPPVDGYPVQISYDQNSDTVKWDFFSIPSATTSGAVDIKYDVAARRVLMRLNSRQRDPATGQYLIEGAYVLAA